MPTVAYYNRGHVVMPLRAGAASLVIYRNGTATVADWGPGTRRSPRTSSAVRQNLDLLGRRWQARCWAERERHDEMGATLGNQVYVWRSGIGVTADGALVYVGGPGLNITTLANLLVRGRSWSRDGARYQHRLGELRKLCPECSDCARDTCERVFTSVGHDRDDGALLRILVVPGLLHDVRAQ